MLVCRNRVIDKVDSKRSMGERFAAETLSRRSGEQTSIKYEQGGPMYEITNTIYSVEEGIGVLHIDNLKTPFLKYKKVEGRNELIPKLFFDHPKSMTIKVKEIRRESAMFIAVQENLQKLEEKEQ